MHPLCPIERDAFWVSRRGVDFARTGGEQFLGKG
jgi:hypothetical protein